MAGEFLGCPFCGAQPVVDDDGERVIVKCVSDACGVEPHTFAVPGLAEAREEWNMRANERSHMDELKKTVKQIIPADGWSAVYASGGKPSVSPLCAWALSVDENGETYMEGVVAGESVMPAETTDDFLGYLPPNGDLSVYESRAENYEALNAIAADEATVN